MRFRRLANRSAAAHKLHSTPQQDRMNLISGKDETSSRLPAFSLFSPEAVQTTGTVAICGALESANCRSGPLQYKAWYRYYIGAQYPFLTDADCYSLRCGVVHQGQLGLPGSRFDRVMFRIGGMVGAHNNILVLSAAGAANLTVLQLDAPTFCRALIAAAR